MCETGKAGAVVIAFLEMVLWIVLVLDVVLGLCTLYCAASLARTYWRSRRSFSPGEAPADRLAAYGVLPLPSYRLSL